MARATWQEASTSGCSERVRADGATDADLSDEDHVSLCEVLDRVLNKGVVVAGEVVISVADIDLVYLGLHLILTSVETARRQKSGAAQAAALHAESLT
jgi:hypothetical protein